MNDYESMNKVLNDQKEFWEIVQKHPNYKHQHGWKHPKSRISQLWLSMQGSNFYTKKISNKKLLEIEKIKIPKEKIIDFDNIYPK